jgi:hypothetical protein
LVAPIAGTPMTSKEFEELKKLSELLRQAKDPAMFNAVAERMLELLNRALEPAQKPRPN